MITSDDIGKVKGIYESGFGDLSISKVFAFGMLKKRIDWLNEESLNEFLLKNAKAEGVLDIPRIKPTRVDNESVKSFYRELSRSKNTDKEFDKVWMGLATSYFRADSPLVSGDATGPRNSPFTADRKCTNSNRLLQEERLPSQIVRIT